MEIDVAFNHIIVDGELMVGLLLLVDRVYKQKLSVLLIERVLAVLEQLDLVLREGL